MNRKESPNFTKDRQRGRQLPQLGRGTILLFGPGLLLAALFVLYAFHHYFTYDELLIINVEVSSSNFQSPSLAVATGVNSLPQSSDLSITEQLEEILFLNTGEVTKKDQFVWKKIICYYLESQNVSLPYIGWADVNECNYLFQVNNGELDSPPSGMRSSIPHGGISTGVFEVRTDGTFHEWTIFNQHPAGSAKMQIMDEMFMGVRTQENVLDGQIVSKVLQTHPSNSLPQTGVWSLEYKGSYPVSKLTVSDPELPIDMSVYIYHWYKHNDMNTSATPAVAFTATLTNTNKDTAFNASFLMNLPLGVEAHTRRSYPQMPKFVPILVNGTPADITYDDIKDKLPRGPTKVFKLSGLSEDKLVMECFSKCSLDEDCLSWSVCVDEKQCFNYDEHVRLNGHQDGYYSGVKTHWSVDSECLTVNRDTPGFNTNGNMSLCAYSSDKNFTISMGAGDSISSMWNNFTLSGQIPSMPNGPHATGMVSGQVTLEPNETKEVTIVLGWYFPDRDFLGLPVGNYYSHLFKDSSEAARFLGGNLHNAVTNASKLHSPFFGSNVPPALQDMLINSLSHIRSAFWLRDGRWRQWEAHDCVNIDSVHNDGERHIPYIMIFPDSVMNKIRGWASFQLPNGMIQEEFRQGYKALPIEPITVEFGAGRVMSDVSSMFIVYLLELLQWHPDPATNEFVKNIWPYAKRAAQWQMNVSKDGGLPKYMVSTYDLLGLSAYPYSSYNGAFHLLAMRACQRLAEWMNDTGFATECKQAFSVGQDAMDRLLWNSTHKYYNAYITTAEEFKKEEFFESTNINLCSYPEYHREEWGTCYEGDPISPGAVMTDTFYSQVLAYSLGLGTLVKDEDKLRSHLKAEREMADTNKGMTALNGRFTGPIIPFTDHSIWMMGDANWASLFIHLTSDFEAVDIAIKELLEPFDHWRTGLNDMWNVAGILSSGNYTDKNVPFITSHYGFYMSSWHVLFALSGQNIDVNKKSVTFSPKIKPPFKLPVMIPTVWGSLKSVIINSTHVMYTLGLEFGRLEFEVLTVSGCVCSNEVRVLSVGHPLSWPCKYQDKHTWSY